MFFRALGIVFTAEVNFESFDDRDAERVLDLAACQLVIPHNLRENRQPGRIRGGPAIRHCHE